MNPKIAWVLLEWYRPETYGKPRKEAVPQRGGVLVVGQITKKPKPKRNTAASVRTKGGNRCRGSFRRTKT